MKKWTPQKRAFSSSPKPSASLLIDRPEVLEAKIALAKQDSGDNFYKAKLATARFYFARLYPETAMLIRQARSGSANLMALDADLF